MDEKEKTGMEMIQEDFHRMYKDLIDPEKRAETRRKVARERVIEERIKDYGL